MEREFNATHITDECDVLVPLGPFRKLIEDRITDECDVLVQKVILRYQQTRRNTE